ncbi:MAG: GC-type dockerin domain-anchored protein [Planctomycetota bacterium]
MNSSRLIAAALLASATFSTSSLASETVSAEFTGPGGGQVGLAGSRNQAGQSFTPLVAGELSSLSLSLRINGAGVPNLIVSIFETNSVGLPTGPVLAQSTLTTALPGQYAWFDFDFSGSGLELQAGELYAWTLQSSGEGGYRAETAVGNPYQDGEGLIYFTDGPWEPMADNFIFGQRDVLFVARVGDEAEECAADVNDDQALDIDDFSAFVTAFFADDLAADQDGNDVLDIDDFSSFVSNFFAGCDF